MRASRPLSLLAAVGLLAAGCRARPTRAALPPPPQIVELTISDTHYAYNPKIHPGRTVFVCRNLGQVTHTALLIPVGEDFPPVDVQLHGSVRRSVQILAGTGVKPGARGIFAVDLTAGQRYYLEDLNRGPDLQIYAFKGLASEFRAR